jgi:DNA invertase Pin-like site-specific DNA recombinase
MVGCFFPDKAEGGVGKDRKELRKLLRECRAGRVGTIVIPSIDRLSRDVRLAENLFHEFDQLGVHVLIADMPTYNGKDRKDVLIRQIREAIAEENRKDIIERLWKGRQERVRRGLPPRGQRSLRLP